MPPTIIIILAFLALSLTQAVSGQLAPAQEVVVMKCWSSPTGDAAGRALAIEGERLFLARIGAKVETLTNAGKNLWATELGGEISSNLLPLESGLLLVTSATTPPVSGEAAKAGESSIRSLSKDTGITNWVMKVPYAERHYLGGFNGAVIVVSKSGSIQSINAKTGEVKWKREIAEGFETAPVFDATTVSLAASGKQIFVISMSTGEIESLRKSSFAVTALGESSVGELVSGDERGNVLSLLGGTDKANWRFKTGGAVARVLAAVDGIIVTSNDNFVYFLTGRSGDVGWKKRLAGRISHIGVIPHRFALIAGFEENFISLISIPSGKLAGQIAFAPDENVASDPVISSDLIFILTVNAVYAYTINSCPQAEKAARTISPPAADLK